MPQLKPKEFRLLLQKPLFLELLKLHCPQSYSVIISWLNNQSNEEFFQLAFANLNVFLESEFEGKHLWKKLEIDELLKLNLSRRGFFSFLGGTAAVSAALAIGADRLIGSKPPQDIMELRKKILSDFIYSPPGYYLTRGEIESLLYDVSTTEEMVGRAFHLGDGYFLTNKHVVGEDLSILRLFHQSDSRNKMPGFPFEILSQNSEYDIALLHSPSFKKTGRAIIHLSNTGVSVKNIIVEFYRLFGRSPRQDLIQELKGVDYFNPKKPLLLGSYRLLRGSLLFERQGFVLEDASEIVKTKLKWYRPELFFLSSIVGFNGESGQPTFRQVGEDK